MNFILEYWQLILGIAAMLFGYVVLILRPQLRENDTKNIYQSLAEPRVLIQYSELEKDYQARYERERMRYLDARNRWAIIQTPVIYFPMNACFEVEWFGEKHYPSTIGLSYDEYQMAAITFQRKLKAIWDKKTGAAFGTKEMMEMTRQQKPFNPEKLWQNTLN